MHSVGICAWCGGSTDLCAICATAADMARDRAAHERRAAEQWQWWDGWVTHFRWQGREALKRKDYRTFFEMAAECARAMSRREAILDEAAP